ncbi:MAG TPA: response regulator [Candidatus Limnocylindrales bacterium]|nr:response regulator [Candidatus Limnocylindrales bacterium]
MAEPLADDPRPVVLVVEDEAPNRALLRAVFGRAADPRLREATLIEAPDLATARSIIARHRVEIVLLDIRLPDGNGLTLARELRRRPAADRPRVLVLSASVLPGEREAALAAGVDRFLGKPYRPSELVDTVLELVEAGPGGDAGQT